MARGPQDLVSCNGGSAVLFPGPVVATDRYDRIGSALVDRAMASPRVIGAVRRPTGDCIAITARGDDRADLFLRRDLREQLRKQRAVALAARGELDRAHIDGVRVHCDVDLSPLPAPRCSMLAGQPFAIAAKLDAGAIDKQVQGLPRCTILDLHRDPRLSAAKRRMVRYRPVEHRHPDQALDQPGSPVGSNQWCLHWLTLPKRQAEQNLQRQASLDCSIREDFLPSALASLLRMPDHVRIEPDRQRASAAQRRVIV